MNPIWVGLFEVTGPPDHNILNGSRGAFLWVAAQAEDATKLRLRAASAMRDLGLTVVSVDKLQTVEDEDDLSEEVSKLIPQARNDVGSVVCGTWHKFKFHSA